MGYQEWATEYHNQEQEHYDSVYGYDNELANEARAFHEAESEAEYHFDFYQWGRDEGLEEWLIDYLWEMEQGDTLQVPRNYHIVMNQDADADDFPYELIYINPDKSVNTVDDIPF